MYHDFKNCERCFFKIHLSHDNLSIFFQQAAKVKKNPLHFHHWHAYVRTLRH